MTNAFDLVPDPAAAPPLRWGIIGPGGIARRFAREIPRHTASVVAAVGSRERGRAERFAREFGVDRAYGSYEELVADPGLDAVYIASPHSAHRDHALLALEAGKPVLVEKAFALSARQAAEVFAAARRLGLFCMEAMWSRFLPHYAALRQLVQGGTLGELRHLLGVHAQSLNLDPGWRMMNPALGGGALLDLGVYPVSLFHFLAGRPESVAACGVLAETGVDLRENLVLGYGQGALAVALNDMSAPGRSPLAVVGSEARVDIDDWFYTPSDLLLTPRGGQPTLVAAKPDGGFQYEAAEAARQIAAGALESPLMPWQATLEVLEILDEARRQLGVEFPGA
ncbi:MAG: Gfo/Idh/MocA family oxidoreductase [Propionibacteriaceae bacterium]|jgi:predicted dehydrogenase|nr:Gfo/Idh/MocA family oxidoreductase [Propionibacteriaceae bacterium]